MSKSQATISSMFIVALIAFTILATIGLSVNSLLSSYDQEEVTYFEGYSESLTLMNQTGVQIIGDYDFNQNDSNADLTTTEDYLFFKSFTIVRKFPSMLTGVGKGLIRLSADLGINPLFTGLIIAIIGIGIIIAIVNFIRGLKSA